MTFNICRSTRLTSSSSSSSTNLMFHLFTRPHLYLHLSITSKLLYDREGQGGREMDKTGLTIQPAVVKQTFTLLRDGANDAVAAAAGTECSLLMNREIGLLLEPLLNISMSTS